MVSYPTANMARSSVILLHWFDPHRGIFYFLPITLALITSVLIFSYISSTSHLLIIHPTRLQSEHHLNLLLSKPSLGNIINDTVLDHEKLLNFSSSSVDGSTRELAGVGETHHHHQNSSSSPPVATTTRILSTAGEASESQWSPGIFQKGNKGEHVDNDNIGDVFHDRTLFLEEYKEMNKSLKIYIYPHSKKDPFSNIFLPMKHQEQPGGNYASESYFKKSLFNSHFITKNPSEAHLFFLPFSIASLRHDRRVGVAGIQEFVKNYVYNISRDYPYWNRTGGADHFYVGCHSVGRSAMEKAVQVKVNAIQVVCSSSYFLAGYVSHKDASIPQIWPRTENPHPIRSPAKRGKLAFYAGAMNSRVRQFLVKEYENDSQMSVHRTRLKTPYSESLLGSKFCIQAKGFEVNTARIGDALYYGCVPVILADHYDLPFADVLNWKSFSVVVSTVDIPKLKKMLLEMVNNNNNYVRLQENVMEVQKHFQWNNSPLDYDAFYMVMYELWIRRSHVSVI